MLTHTPNRAEVMMQAAAELIKAIAAAIWPVVVGGVVLALLPIVRKMLADSKSFEIEIAGNRIGVQRATDETRKLIEDLQDRINALEARPGNAGLEPELADLESLPVTGFDYPGGAWPPARREAPVGAPVSAPTWYGGPAAAPAGLPGEYGAPAGAPMAPAPAPAPGSPVDVPAGPDIPAGAPAGPGSPVGDPVAGGPAEYGSPAGAPPAGYGSPAPAAYGSPASAPGGYPLVTGRRAGQRKLLWVDDQPDSSVYERARAVEAGYTVLRASSTAEALRLLSAEGPVAMVVSDMSRVEPGGSYNPRAGLDMVQSMRGAGDQTPVVFYSGPRSLDPVKHLMSAVPGVTYTTSPSRLAAILEP